ncbi:hypothetical protein A2U01_0060840, partial [Trifolium medium]|nr:hypothetical protein [Trifolium medium]
MARNGLHTTELTKDSLRKVPHNHRSTSNPIGEEGDLLERPCHPVVVIWGPVDIECQHPIKRRSISLY